MISRKDKYFSDKRKKVRKKLIGTVLLIGLVGGSYSVAFAEADIGALLASWFDSKKIESLTKIEQAIDSERITQTGRLKQELQLEIERAESALDEFTAIEIKNRQEKLREYTDQLIGSINIDNAEEQRKIIAQIEEIYEKAKKELERVKTKGQSPIKDEPVKEESEQPEKGEENPSNPIVSPPPVDKEVPEEPAVLESEVVAPTWISEEDRARMQEEARQMAEEGFFVSPSDYGW